MADDSGAKASADAGLWGAMREVVIGLRHEYPLLFGIGAGLVLVLVLGVTGNTVALVVVAVVLLAALATWIVWKAMTRKHPGTAVRRSKLEGSKVGNVRGAGSAAETTVEDSTVTDSEIGNVDLR